MKKIMRGLAAALALVIPAAACAEARYIVNCDEWVSLRAEADTSSERIEKVPLGTPVYEEKTSGRFSYCRVSADGSEGWILSEYLGYDDTALYAGGHTIRAERGHDGGGEAMEVRCSSEDGGSWDFRIVTPYMTELTLTKVMIGGTASDPRVLVYGAGVGLYCLDIETGETVWSLSADEADFGGSLSHAVGADGTLYIAGWYTPRVTAVDMDGNTLWSADPAETDIFGTVYLEADGDSVLAVYEPDTDGSRPARARYSAADGAVISIETE